MVKLLDKYLLKEAFFAFFFAVIGFILIGLVDTLFTLIDLFVNRGVAFLLVCKLLAFRIPSIIILFLPMAILFSVMLLFIRIAKDNELTILRSSGISLGRILCPVMIFMLGISFLSFYLDSYLVPWSNYVSNELIRKVVLKDPQPDITERIFFKDTQNRFFYIDHVDLKSHLYSQVMIYETCGTYPRVILAKFAQWQQNQWVLRDGKIHRYNDQGYLSYDMAFQEMTIDVNYNPEQFFNKQKSSYEMSAKELQTQIKMFKQGGISTTRLAVDYHMKFSFAGASFIFGMIGLMLTSILVRSGKDWWKVITAVLLALLCVGFYFFLMAFFRSFGYGGMISPLWAAWTPNLIFGSIGGIVLIHEVIYR